MFKVFTLGILLVFCSVHAEAEPADAYQTEANQFLANITGGFYANWVLKNFVGDFIPIESDYLRGKINKEFKRRAQRHTRQAVGTEIYSLGLSGRLSLSNSRGMETSNTDKPRRRLKPIRLVSSFSKRGMRLSLLWSFD